jgi:hypothetical protein
MTLQKVLASLVLIGATATAAVATIALATPVKRSSKKV